jgi:hypothetical protein
MKEPTNNTVSSRLHGILRTTIIVDAAFCLRMASAAFHEAVKSS